MRSGGDRFAHARERERLTGREISGHYVVARERGAVQSKPAGVDADRIVLLRMLFVVTEFFFAT